MKDKDIYSSSSLIHYLRVKHNLDIVTLSSILNEPITAIYKIRDGSRVLGRDNYEELLLLYPELPLCDFEGTYINPNWKEGIK